MYNFIQLFNDYHIDNSLDVNDWINFECPVCHHSGTRGKKGGINLTDGHFNCWSCGPSSSTEKVLSLLLKVSYSEIKNILQNYSLHTQVVRQINKKKVNAKSIQLPGGPLEDIHKKYLAKRGFDPEELVSLYHIQGTGITGYWRYRIIIPIVYNKTVISFQGRSIFSKRKCEEYGILRYLTESVENSLIDPKSICYNMDNAKGESVILTEGPFDVFRLGPKDVVATLGTSISDQQINLLAKRYKKVFIVFDPEIEAQKRALQYGERLNMLGIDIEILDTEFLSDPGDSSILEKKQILSACGIYY